MIKIKTMCIQNIIGIIMIAALFGGATILGFYGMIKEFGLKAIIVVFGSAFGVIAFMLIAKYLLEYNCN